MRIFDTVYILLSRSWIFFLLGFSSILSFIIITAEKIIVFVMNFYVDFVKRFRVQVCFFLVTIWI